MLSYSMHGEHPRESIKLNINSTMAHLTPNLRAFTKSKFSSSPPSKTILIIWHRVEVFNLFPRSVFIRFIDEKHLSHSAVLTGRISAIDAEGRDL